METLDSKKEIAKYKPIVAKAERYSENLEIETLDRYKEALAEGQNIKKILSDLTKRKEEITKPMNAALKSVRELFKPFETKCEDAIDTIKKKMLEWTNEQARVAEAAKQKLAERVERGTMKAETAIRKMDEIAEPEKTVSTEAGQATAVVRKAYRVTDKAKIPSEFMEPDMVRIKQEFRAGRPVAGVEEYEETGISFS